MHEVGQQGAGKGTKVRNEVRSLWRIHIRGQNGDVGGQVAARSVTSRVKPGDGRLAHLFPVWTSRIVGNWDLGSLYKLILATIGLSMIMNIVQISGTELTYAMIVLMRREVWAWNVPMIGSSDVSTSNLSARMDCRCEGQMK